MYNAALVADGADPGDLDAFRASAERARDTLGLGLEYLTGGDPRRAPAVVRETPFRTVFQTGFSLGLRLRHRADRLAARPLARLDGEWMLWPEQASTVTALRRARPMRALPVEGAEPVPFRSLAEIRQAEEELARAEAAAGAARGAARRNRGAGPRRRRRARRGLARRRHARGARGGGGPRAAGWGRPGGPGPGVAGPWSSDGPSSSPARPRPSGPRPWPGPPRCSRGSSRAPRPSGSSGAVLDRLADQMGKALLSGPLPVEVQTTLPWSAGL